MVYRKHKEGRGRGRTLHSSRAILLQQCGPYRWGGQCNDSLVHKSVGVNEYLVKAKASGWGPSARGCEGVDWTSYILMVG